MGASEWLARALDDTANAFALLTRLPIQRPGREEGTARAVWAYPLVGAVVGLIGGGVYWLLGAIGCPPALSAVWAVAATILVTGALHEDGLADCADALGAHTRERRLDIMRDSRTGVYGVLALLVAVGARIVALASLAAPVGVLCALISGHTVSRAMAGALMAALPHARNDGLSVSTGRPHVETAAAGMLLAVVLLVASVGLATALGALLLAGGSAMLVGWVAHRLLGGQTGDVLGACVVLTEVATLTVIAAAP